MKRKVKQLIAELKKLNQDAVVFIEYNGGGGCKTCGLGSDRDTDDFVIVDLEKRVVLSTVI